MAPKHHSAPPQFAKAHLDQCRSQGALARLDGRSRSPYAVMSSRVERRAYMDGWDAADREVRRMRLAAVARQGNGYATIAEDTGRARDADA